jgi:hypothetical protein
MKNIFTTFFSLMIGVSLMAQSTFNDPNAEVRDVKGFHGIKVATGIQLVLTQGTTEAVAISAPDAEERARIKTVVENGILKINYDYDWWKLMHGKINKKLKAYVSIVKVDYLNTSSGAALQIDGELKANDLTLKASSGGIMKGKINATSISADNSSGGITSLSGTADNLNVDASSGGVFNGYDFAVNTCDARTSSGGALHVTVNKDLSGRASSGGLIAFKGDGTIKSKRTSSGGDVRKVK